jgi:hypothetical protein
MSNLKAIQIDSIHKRKGRATEWRITFWDDSGDYATYTTITGHKRDAATIAHLAKDALADLGIIPKKCKTTIEKTF